MIDMLNNTTDSRICYTSPEIKVVFIKAQAILCLSGGNKSMSENELNEDEFESI